MNYEAYNAGKLAALEKLGLEAPAPGLLKRFWRAFSGRGVDEAVGKEYLKLHTLPAVQEEAMRQSSNMDTLYAYLHRAVQGQEYIPALTEGKGNPELIKSLIEGRAVTQAAQNKQLGARALAAGAVAAPVGVGLALARGGAKQAAHDDLDPIGAAAAGAAGAVPFIQGTTSGALGGTTPASLRIKDLMELEKMVRPGDILLTGYPGYGGITKAMAAPLGSDPFTVHVESVTGIGDKGLTRIHSMPGEGGAYEWGPSHLSADKYKQDFTIRRFRDPAHVKPFLENLAKRRTKEDVLGKLLGPSARARMYDRAGIMNAGLRSTLPAPLQRALTREPALGASVCSTLPGMCSPVHLAPKGVPIQEVLPHHILRSEALETIAQYRTPRNWFQQGFEGLYHAAPWLLRAGIAASLGYGAYKGVKALTSKD